MKPKEAWVICDGDDPVAICMTKVAMIAAFRVIDGDSRDGQTFRVPILSLDDIKAPPMPRWRRRDRLGDDA